jgi:site-specific recombinase XerD
MIEVMVSRYARAAGLEKKVTPHVWRHTCATHLVADGANIAYVQRLLGHRSLRTTQIYTRTTIAEIKATHAKAHPQARSRSGHAYKPAIGREGKPLLYRKCQP